MFPHVDHIGPGLDQKPLKLDKSEIHYQGEFKDGLRFVRPSFVIGNNKQTKKICKVRERFIRKLSFLLSYSVLKNHLAQHNNNKNE